LIGDVAWGYNRDGEKLPQVNLCMPLGEQSRLPVFQTLYNGSIKDVNTLKSTLQGERIKTYPLTPPVGIVLARGLIIKSTGALFIRFSAIISFRSVFPGGNYGYSKTGAVAGGVF
jgi:hypothetical protein